MKQALPFRMLYVNRSTLKSDLTLIGSQWREAKTGAMWTKFIENCFDNLLGFHVAHRPMQTHALLYVISFHMLGYLMFI